MIDNKLDIILELLKEKQKLAVAYSGGIDSTLLLSLAVEALGAGNVLALNIKSVLHSSESIQNCQEVLEKNFPPEMAFKQIELSPLQWSEFVTNTELRCYYCKQKIYTTLLGVARENGFSCLADGTNADDLLEHRPGLQAIKELKVFTPLEKVGFTKQEIRSVAKQRGLSNHDLSSNSCLATRVKSNVKIDLEKLHKIENAEAFLCKLGMKGCRVRIGGDYTVLELEDSDMILLNKINIRQRIEDHILSIGLKPSVIRLIGR